MARTKIVKLTLIKPVVALGAVGLSITTGFGVASADPDLSPIINTTCSYPQVEAALRIQAPDLANQLSASPMAQSELQSFLNSPVAQRQQMVQQLQGTRWGQRYVGTLLTVAQNCN
jgi:hemophore-related protein